jgi:hypothetical protein
VRQFVIANSTGHAFFANQYTACLLRSTRRGQDAQAGNVLPKLIQKEALDRAAVDELLRSAPSAPMKDTANVNV